MQPNHLNIIVGQNDIGKSNFLKALNLFFNGETDLHSGFRFADDFSHYTITPNKKAEEITIKLRFNSHKKYSKSEDLIWTKVWRRDGLHKDEILTVSGTPPSKKGGAIQWVKKVKYKYVPAVRGQEYFNYLMGELHDALSEINPTAFNLASGNFIQGLKSQVATLVNDITVSLGYSSEIGMPSDFKMLFSTLDFGFTTDGRVISLNKRGDGIKAQHIPIILKFIANHYKSISGKAIINPDTIWGFEEPENNMEMGNAFKLAKIFLNFSTELQMFINTHSPAFYSLAKDNQRITNLYLVKADELIKSTKLFRIGVSEISRLDEEVGILPMITEHIKKEVELRQNAELKAEQLNKLRSKTKYVVFTEDTDMSFCKALFRMQGFNDDETEYISYESRSNLSAAIVSCRFKISEKPELKHIIFHRDRDVFNNDEFDFESINLKIEGLNKGSLIRHTLFKTKGYDLESYLLNAAHIHELYPTISIQKACELITMATEEKMEDGLNKLLEKIPIIQSEYAARGELKKFSMVRYIGLLTEEYKANVERYRYGKKVYGVLKSLLQKETKKNINLLDASCHIVIPELRALLASDSDELKKVITNPEKNVKFKEINNVPHSGVLNQLDLLGNDVIPLL